MNQNKEHIEVIITKKDLTFTASSPAYPKCRGIGETEKDALLKLGNSIGNFIGRVTKNHIKTILSGNDFSEVIVDPSDKKSIQHRVFSLNTDTPPKKKEILVKVNPLHVPNSPKISKKIFSELDKEVTTSDIIHETSQVLVSKESFINLLYSEAPTLLTDKEEDFGFGIPICLN
jgi:hypothetical protein